MVIIDRSRSGLRRISAITGTFILVLMGLFIPHRGVSVHLSGIYGRTSPSEDRGIAHADAVACGSQGGGGKGGGGVGAVVRGVPVRVRAVVAALVILTPAMALVLARLLPVVGLAVVSN